MNRCETCKHWGEPFSSSSWDENPILPVRHCEAVPEIWEATRWEEDGEGRELVPEYSNTLAFASDGSQYRADLYTKAEYGCPMHEPKA